MKSLLKVRLISTDDIPHLQRIYAHYVRHTSITFETNIPDETSYSKRLQDAHICICATYGDTIVGFAYAGRHRAKRAYDTVCESTIYMHEQHTGKGYGVLLYKALLSILKHMGYFTVLGGITTPNPASAALHKRCGFVPFCTYENIGFKQGAWHSVDWLRCDLRSFDTPPIPVLNISDLNEETLNAFLQ